MEIKFYRCETCGNIIAYIKNSGVPVFCCGKPMQEIIPSTIDTAYEKHVPVVKREGNKVVVTVGDVLHPMVKEHFIEWICIQTKHGNQRKFLKPNDKPELYFYLGDGDEVEAVYEYCNIHGLWKA